MRKLSSLLFVIILASAYPSRAQTSFGIGGSLGTTPVPHAALSLNVTHPLAGNDSTFLMLSGDVRNVSAMRQGGVPSYVATMNIAQKMFQQGWLKVYGDAGMGALETRDALTGAVRFGGYVPLPIRIPFLMPKSDKVQLMFAAHGQHSPATGLQGNMQLYLQIEP